MMRLAAILAGTFTSCRQLEHDIPIPELAPGEYVEDDETVTEGGYACPSQLLSSIS